MPYKDKSRYLTEEYREYRRKYQRAWHQKHKGNRRAKVSERKSKLREFHKQLKENLVCAQCGENHPAALQFHHRDPKTKDFNLAEIKQRAFSLERIIKEIAKCTVLCANCHAKLHYESSQEKSLLSQDHLGTEMENLRQKLEILQEEFQDQSDALKEANADSPSKSKSKNIERADGKRYKLSITKALAGAGYNVLKPCNQIRHYDLVIEDANGNFWRVLCKAAQLSKDRSTLKFAGNYIPYRQKHKNGEIMGSNHRDEVDYLQCIAQSYKKHIYFQLPALSTQQMCYD